MPHLFEPFTLRGTMLRNRVVVSPMCQYSSVDGFATDWHLAHLGSRAVGGAGLVIVEATAVSPEGRITPNDLGIYRDEHVAKLREIATFVDSVGAVPGIQLAHAGRKASCAQPWHGGGRLAHADGGWTPVAPSAIAYDAGDPAPRELTVHEIEGVIRNFVVATERALRAGFRAIEIHGAHGYLLHEFLSPLVNRRTDAYGGSFEGRTRLLREVTTAVRAALPDDVPLFVRISATDWAEGGWDLDQSVRLCADLARAGADLIDVSSGGAVAHQQIALEPEYQVPFAARIRAETGVPTGAVGLITEPRQAEAIVADGRADIVLLARAFLRDPYWTTNAALALGAEPPWPVQYGRARPQLAPV